MNRIEKLLVALVLVWLLAHSPAMGQEWSVSGPVGQAANTYVASGDSPVVLRLDDTGADDYIVTGQLLMSKAKASVRVGLGKVHPKSVARNPSAARITGRGNCLAFNGLFRVPPKVYSVASSAPHWSVDWTVLPKLNKLWVNFAFRVIGDAAELRIMLPDYQAASLTVPADRRSPWIVLRGAKVRNLSVKPLAKLPPLMLPITIDHAVNVKLAGEGADANLGVKIDSASLPRGVKVVDGVPFCFPESADAQAIDVVKLKRLVRKVSRKNPARSYAERGFSLEVRGDQYSAVHLIAFSGRRPGTVPRLDVRVGYVQRTADEWVDQAADVPYLSDGKSDKAVSSIPVKLADGSQGYVHHIRLPMPQTGQLREYGPLAVQFTRRIEIKPDEFLRRSVEPPSGAVVLAVTMERAQVTMSYTADERCNLFSEGQKAVFQLKLANCSGKKVLAQAYAKCAGPGLPREQNPRFLEWTVARRVALAPGEAKDVPLDVTPKARGWFACTIGVEADGRVQQVRDTTFAYLAPDTRKAMEDSPFGIWCYWNGHAITQDRDRTEKFYSIINKGGWRWTLGGPGCQYPPKDYLPAGTRKAAPSIEEQAAIHRYQADKYKFKVTFAKPPMDCTSSAIGPGYGERPRYDAKGFEAKVLPWIDWVRKSGMDNACYVLHESRFDGDAILANFSELLGGVPYPWKPKTKALFEQQFQNVRDYCRALKRAAPDARIVLINDGPQYALEYMKAGFPADAFDVLGLEVCGYQHLPEIQPDWLTVLGDLHTNKLMQAKYGYNKPVWLTESLYHSTRPGAMWLHEQAVIMVREAMICLAFGVQRMTSCNTTNDCANSYGRSLWGRAGVCFRDPEYNPKTSFAMYAWLTQILDQAKCVGKLKHDSTTLHATARRWKARRWSSGRPTAPTSIPSGWWPASRRLR